MREVGCLNQGSFYEKIVMGTLKKGPGKKPYDSNKMVSKSALLDALL